MKANELRIGNLVNYFGKTYYAIGINKESSWFVSAAESVTGLMQVFNVIESFEPIPLTPELLEACGFKVDVWSELLIDSSLSLQLGRTESSDGLPYHVFLTQLNEGLSIQEAANIQKDIPEANDDAFILSKSEKVYLKPIQYLHQLQNLFYTLRGEELEVKIKEKNIQ